MRDFTDADGGGWSAFVLEEEGPDYKGRCYLVMRPADASDRSRDVVLEDVRWNAERTARRTLDTMSVVELRRRLRAAVGRGSVAAVGG